MKKAIAKKVSILTLLVAVLLSSSLVKAEEKADVRIALPADLEKNVGSLFNKSASKLGISIEIDYYESVEEYRENVNTRILAGDAPDILYANAIPYWDCAKMGMLADIGRLLEKEEYYDDLDQGIISGLRDDKGKLYVLPCSYWFYVYIINDELAEQNGIVIPEDLTFEDIINLCVEFNEKSQSTPGVYTLLGGDSYFNQLILQEVLANIDFNKGTHNLSDMDNKTKAMEYLNTVHGLTRDYIYNPDKYFCIIAWMSNGKVTYPGLPANLMMNEKYRVGVMPRMNHEESPIYELEKAFCISKGKNVDKAWELLNELMSFENQSGITGLYSNPIRQSAVEKRFNNFFFVLQTISRSPLPCRRGYRFREA